MSTLFVRVESPATSVGSLDVAATKRSAIDSVLDPAEDALESADAQDEVLAPEYELSAQWLISEPDGRVRAEGETDLRGLSELIDPDTAWVQNPANVVLLVPAGLVLNINCEVPGRNSSQVRRALPFAVEEFVATDIEAMHVAAGDIARGGMIRSLVIERAPLDGWLAALRSIGIRPGYALSAAEILPGAKGQSTLLFDGDEVLMRSVDSAACIDAENLEFVIGQFIEASGEGAAIETVNGEIDPLAMAQLPVDLEFSKTMLASDQSVLGYLAGLWQERGPLADKGINLLQGEYGVRMNATGERSRWRTVAMLAAGWFGIALLSLAVKGIYSDSEADRLRSDTHALYKDIYPDTQRIPPNLQRDVQFRMGDSAVAAAQFVPLIGGLTTHLSSAIKVRSFNFQGSRDELSTELILSGFDALDALKEKLAGDGMSVEISSAEQQTDGVHARLRLRSGNAQ